jgi:hypothetical protein
MRETEKTQCMYITHEAITRCSKDSEESQDNLSNGELDQLKADLLDVLSNVENSYRFARASATVSKYRVSSSCLALLEASCVICDKANKGLP